MRQQVSAEKQALITAAAREGLQVTSKQIDRWRLNQLLPAPKLRSRGKGLGIARVVDESVDAQLIALARILKQNRSLDNAAFRLWIAGFPIPIERVRLALKQLVQEPLLRFTATSEERKASSILKLESSLSKRKSVPNSVRTRAQKEELAPFLHAMFQAAMGPKPDLSPDNKRRFARDFEEISGLTRARTESPTPDIKPWLSGDTSDSIFEAMDLASGLMHVFDDADDAHLTRTRELFVGFEKMRAWSNYAKQVYGHAFGIESLTDGWLGANAHDNDAMMFTVLLLFATAKPEVLGQMEAVLSTVSQAVTHIESQSGKPQN